MTFEAGQHAPNRKLPSNDKLRAHLAAGMTAMDIAKAYDVAANNVRWHLRKHAMLAPATTSGNSRQSATEPAEPTRHHPGDTAHKVIRNGISRARVPSIDGHFQGVEAP